MDTSYNVQMSSWLLALGSWLLALGRTSARAVTPSVSEGPGRSGRREARAFMGLPATRSLALVRDARNLAVVEVLLARGADPNARDKSRGSTPLRRAVSGTGAGGTAGHRRPDVAAHPTLAGVRRRS